MRKIIFGIRKSRLAGRQLDEFIAHLESKKIPFKPEVVRISTGGDKNTALAIEDLGVGVFIKELERALVSGKIDCAVHSLKDVPVGIQSGTTLSCFIPRADARDCVVWRPDDSVKGRLKGLKIATSSPRREAFIKELEKDVEVVPLRGNVDTRVKKCQAGEFDAMVLAVCGLKRLGLENNIGLSFDPESFVPAAGQGVICGQTRSLDKALNAELKRVSDIKTEKAANSERSVIESLGIGCRTAFGVYARFIGESFLITAKSFSEVSGRYISRRLDGMAKDYKKITEELIITMRSEMSA